MTALQEPRRLAPSRSVSLRPRLRLVLLLTAVADLVALTTATLLAWDLRHGYDVWATLGAPLHPRIADHAAPLVIGSWLLSLVLRGGYDARNVGEGTEEFRVVANASLLTALSVGLVCFFWDLRVSPGFIVGMFLFGTLGLLIERYAVRRLVRRARRAGALIHDVVVVGGASAVREVVQALAGKQHVGYRVVGACCPDEYLDAGELPVPVLARTAHVRQVCADLGADTVLVCRGGDDASARLRRIAWDLEGSKVDLIVSPSLVDVAGPRIRMRPVAGLPLLHLEQPKAVAATGGGKRAFDAVTAALGLLLLSPLLLLLAVVVRLQDGGPVLFVQTRVGRDGRPFRMLKFRSMVVDAEDRLADLAPYSDLEGVLFKMRADPRVTRVGRFLRRFSLDELPQLVNVVRGDMSLVGPRPPLPSEVEKYATDVHRRLLVRPGLTGLWQVSGRSELSWEESVRLDLYYVDNWSMMADLVIIAKTVRAVVGSDGAY